MLFDIHPMSERWSGSKVEREIAKRERASWSTDKGYQTWARWQRVKAAYERTEDVMRDAERRGISYEQAGVYGFFHFILETSGAIPEVEAHGQPRKPQSQSAVPFNFPESSSGTSHGVNAARLQADITLHPEYKMPPSEEFLLKLSGESTGSRNHGLDYVSGMVADAHTEAVYGERKIDPETVEGLFGE